MSDLVPGEIRGAYFGRRNMVGAATGMVTILGGGAFLSFWDDRHGAASPFGYLILFGIGTVMGLTASFVLTRVKDPSAGLEKDGGKFRIGSLALQFRDTNFVHLVIYVSSFMFVT